jgi:hypothetical protein
MADSDRMQSVMSIEFEVRALFHFVNMIKRHRTMKTEPAQNAPALPFFFTTGWF